MLHIQAMEDRCIDLGRRGENSAVQVNFDISGFAELYGQGEARLIVSRYKDFSPYPAVITQDNNTVSWVVTSVDTNNPGYGHCELVYITEGSVVKSTTYQTLVHESLADPITSPPSPDTTYGEVLKELQNIKNNLPSSGSMSENDQLIMLIETDLLPAIHDTAGAILCDENGNIVLRY